jgi:membrane protease YdiL (CAAX protease family)
MTTNAPEMAAWRLRLRESRLLLLLEFALIAALFVADSHHLVRFGLTPWLLALGWGSIALRGIGLGDLGLRIEPEWMAPVLVGVLAGMLMAGLEMFAIQPLLVRLTGQLPDLTDFHDLEGNYTMLMSLIAGSWLITGLGEELVWRGYVLNRLADLFGRSGAGWAFALVFASVAFGLGYAWLGSISVVEKIIDGLVLGGLYLGYGRRLIVPIIAHVVAETVTLLAIFSGHYPGLH